MGVGLGYTGGGAGLYWGGAGAGVYTAGWAYLVCLELVQHKVFLDVIPHLHKPLRVLLYPHIPGHSCCSVKASGLQ